MKSIGSTKPRPRKTSDRSILRRNRIRNLKNDVVFQLSRVPKLMSVSSALNAFKSSALISWKSVHYTLTFSFSLQTLILLMETSDLRRNLLMCFLIAAWEAPANHSGVYCEVWHHFTLRQGCQGEDMAGVCWSWEILRLSIQFYSPFSRLRSGIASLHHALQRRLQGSNCRALAFGFGGNGRR